MVHTFSCLDGHTCGNPVRLVSGGAPLLKGATMSERRLDFLSHHDWIRKALMFEPRGHDVMSGSILYPPTRADRGSSPTSRRGRSEEHTSELQSLRHLVCRLLLEKKN